MHPAFCPPLAPPPPIDVFINPPVGEPLVITVKQGPVNPDNLPPDLSTATGASLSVRRPTGSGQVIWSVTISEQTFNSLKLTHLFAAGDMPDVGFYVVVATLSFPSGPRRMFPRVLRGIDPFLVPTSKQC